jgi:hypothetical protein
MVAGGLIGFLCDPRSGARRRAVTRDKLGKYSRQTARALRGWTRGSDGRLRGALHDLAGHVPGHAAEASPDTDTFIKQRVESELGHAAHLPLHAVNFDAVEGIVRVRGTVPDADCAEEIVARAAAVEGVRAVVSLMRAPDGTPVGGSAGDETALTGDPLGVVHSRALRERLIARWPVLDDAAILASDGHVDRLAETIGARTNEPAEEVRAALDEMLLATP